MIVGEKLDAQWIDDYKQWSPFPNGIEGKLRSDDAAAQKAAFIENDFAINPNLRPVVDEEKVAEHRTALQSLHDSIAEHEEQSVVRDAYLPRLQSLLGQVELLAAAGVGDTDAFIAANETAHGTLDSTLMDLSLGFFRDLADQHGQEPANQFISDTAKRVEDLLPDSTSSGHSVGPSEHEFKAIQRLYTGFFDDILGDLCLPDTFGKEVSMPAAEAALKNLGFDYKVVTQREGVSTMAVNHASRLVKIPEDVTYTRQRFTGLLGHEVRIHVEERVNGDLQPLGLLYSGLDKYLRGSEGKGVLTEAVAYQTLTDFMSTPRFYELTRRYASIGLAQGADGGEPRDFKDVFKIINAVDLLWEAACNLADPEAAKTVAMDKTWELLAMRTLRGWTGVGAAAIKDKVYLEGFIDQAATLAAKPQLFPFMTSGKYDLSNQEHLSILGQVGTIPLSVLEA